MNIANKITVFRLLMVPIFMFTYLNTESGHIIPLAIFSIAAISDFFDGYLARSRNLVTTFGKFLDPLVDKILVLSAFIMFIEKGLVPSWGVVIIVAREFMVTGLRIIAASDSITIAASPLGKLKTISQFASIVIILGQFFTTNILGIISFYIAVFLTIISGLDYILKNKKIFDFDNI